MSSKARWFFGLGLLVVVAVLVSLFVWGNPLRASPGLQEGAIDLEHYASLRSRVEDLREQGNDVAHLDAIIADIDDWIAQDKAAEANLRIKDLEGALDHFVQQAPPEYPAEEVLPPAPAYSAIPQAGETVLFEEDFSGDNVLAAWQSSFLDFAAGNMAAWQQRQEALFLNMGAGGRQIVGMVAVAGEAWSDCVYGVDILPRGNLEVGAVFRYHEGDFYRFRFLSHEHGSEGTLLLERVMGEEEIILAQADGSGYVPGQWYNVQIVAKGAQISVYLNGELVLEAADDALSNGQVGVYALSLGDVYFDNVRVTSVR